MRHTSSVHGIMYRVALAAAFAPLIGQCRALAQSWQSAASVAAHRESLARIVVLDVTSGHVIAARGLSEAARTLASPGSTLKPLALYQLVATGRWNPSARIACDRQLVISSHRLACSHPAAPPFDASEALTWSCNSYFAAVARTLRPGELGTLLRPTGLLNATGLARAEAIAEFREPQSASAQQLTLLGIDGVRVTPLELAMAYRWLALELAMHPDSDASQVVRSGLADSASFGIAGPASLGGIPVLGKTGTAEGISSPQSHGWFAGLAPAQRPRVVIVVYLRGSRGADAARVAGELLAHAPLERP